MAGVYLLLGPEKGLKEDHIKKIKADLGSCEVSKFYGFEDYESELFAQLNNNDLFADHKLVILEQAQEIKAKDKLKALAEYIKHPSDCATLVITSDDLFVAPEIMGAPMISGATKRSSLVMTSVAQSEGCFIYSAKALSLSLAFIS